MSQSAVARRRRSRRTRQLWRKGARPPHAAALVYIVPLLILMQIPDVIGMMRRVTIGDPTGGESVRATVRMDLWLIVSLRNPSCANTARARGPPRKWELKGFRMML